MTLRSWEVYRYKIIIVLKSSCHLGRGTEINDVPRIGFTIKPMRTGRM